MNFTIVHCHRDRHLLELRIREPRKILLRVIHEMIRPPNRRIVEYTTGGYGNPLLGEQSKTCSEGFRRILSCRGPRGWSMPRVRPHASWLRQVESYLEDAGMTDLASAWAITRRRPREYRRNATTRCSGVCPHT